MSGISDEKIQQMVSRYIKDKIAGLEGGYFDSNDPPFKSVRDLHEHIGFHIIRTFIVFLNVKSIELLI